MMWCADVLIEESVSHPVLTQHKVDTRVLYPALASGPTQVPR